MTTLIRSRLPGLDIPKLFCPCVCAYTDIINLVAQCLVIKDIEQDVQPNRFPQIPMMSPAANQSGKGHFCGLVLKLRHSWAR